MNDASTKERLLSKVFKDPETGCWNWTGALCRNGYGRIAHQRVNKVASRLSYEIFVKDPGSLYVCHKCDNRKCVNPDHLFLGTAVDNLLDAKKKGRLERFDHKKAVSMRRQGFKFKEISEALGVSTGSVFNVCYKELGFKMNSENRKLLEEARNKYGNGGYAEDFDEGFKAGFTARDTLAEQEMDKLKQELAELKAEINEAEKFSKKKASQLFSQWKSDVLKTQNPTISPKSDEELLEIGFKYGRQSANFKITDLTASLKSAVEVIQDTIDSGYDQAGHCFSALTNLKAKHPDMFKGEK
jgi:hypothetical protein